MPDAPVEIVGHDPEWSLRFQEEAETLRLVLAEYEVLKRELAARLRLDRDAYTLAKGPFIDRVTETALQEGFGAGTRPA